MMRRIPGLKAAVRRAGKVQRRFRHAAIALRGGRVMAYAVNSRLHAEVAALDLAEKMASGECVDTVVSIRIGPDGELKLAKPCFACHETLRFAGVETVVYSTATGEFDSEDL